MLVLLITAIILFVIEKFGYSFELLEFLQGFLLGASIAILIGFLVVPVKKKKVREEGVENE